MPNRRTDDQAEPLARTQFQGVPAAARANQDLRFFSFLRWKLPDYASDGEHCGEVRAELQYEVAVNPRRTLIGDRYALVQAAVDVALAQHLQIPGNELERKPAPFASQPAGVRFASIQ